MYATQNRRDTGINHVQRRMKEQSVYSEGNKRKYHYQSHRYRQCITCEYWIPRGHQKLDLSAVKHIWYVSQSPFSEKRPHGHLYVCTHSTFSPPVTKVGLARALSNLIIFNMSSLGVDNKKVPYTCIVRVDNSI
jgi:hypothetical protein